MYSESVLTMNYDLSLSGYCSVRAGHVAEVRATVGDIDTTDGQDANSLCGMGQSFTMGPSVHQAVHLVRRKRLRIIKHPLKCRLAAATYLLARIGPLNLHPCVELHQCCAVQGESLPHHQLYWVLRKQLDIVNLASCPGKRKKGGGTNRGTEGGRQ